mmetsp:Transcript_3109/g.7887  ORF Transcript_3109/g.7887 Transcript_3109/m.7887 type:complete len:208 (+) Transcript_3109:224-847(+)
MTQRGRYPSTRASCFPIQTRIRVAIPMSTLLLCCCSTSSVSQRDPTKRGEKCREGVGGRLETRLLIYLNYWSHRSCFWIDSALSTSSPAPRCPFSGWSYAQPSGLSQLFHYSPADPDRPNTRPRASCAFLRTRSIPPSPSCPAFRARARTQSDPGNRQTRAPWRARSHIPPPRKRARRRPPPCSSRPPPPQPRSIARRRTRTPPPRR